MIFSKFPLICTHFTPFVGNSEQNLTVEDGEKHAFTRRPKWGNLNLIPLLVLKIKRNQSGLLH